MIETLLIIALVIATLFDAIRVCQYVNLRKMMRRNNKIDVINRINKLHYEWMQYEGEHCISFGKYCLEHWEEEE